MLLLRQRPAVLAVVLVLLCCFTPRVRGLVASFASAQKVSLQQLLSTCVEACQRGCHEIRKVEEQRQNTGHLEGLEFKQVGDPKSALTKADHRAQNAIVTALQTEWGSLLEIVGEEEEEDGDGNEEDNDDEISSTALQRDLCLDCDATQDISVDLADVTVFVDPLDGTREFVEGRLANCQTLVGIAWKGQAIAGAVGIPFPQGDLSSDSTIVYGQVGAGFGVIGTPLLNPTTRQPETNRPVMALGDSTHKVMNTVRTTILENQLGGSHVLSGGAGTKLLATALGHVDGTVSMKFGGPWDTCAPEAILRTMGGTMTDMAGDPIRIHQSGACRNHNRLGFVATGKDSAMRHDDLMRSLLQSNVVEGYVQEGRALISSSPSSSSSINPQQ